MKFTFEKLYQQYLKIDSIDNDDSFYLKHDKMLELFVNSGWTETEFDNVLLNIIDNSWDNKFLPLINTNVFSLYGKTINDNNKLFLVQ